MSPADISETLRLHALWLRADPAGKRADLTDANLTGADLTDANLALAVLTGADLARAVLTGADLTLAVLTGAKLAGANLARATMLDGRKWEVYRADHLAGICTSPEVHARALAAWGSHEWTSCPMHSALGIADTTEINDAALRRNVEAWVALYDSGLLQPYNTTTKDAP